MEPTEQLEVILPIVCNLVDRITPAQLTEPTPCDQFSVHGVLDHMIVLGTSFSSLFRGEEAPQADAPVVYGWVPAKDFRSAMDDLLAAVRSEGALDRMLDTPIGRMDGATFARVVAFDGLLHGWDLAVATGQVYAVDPDAVAAVDAFARVALTDELRQAGLFSARTPAPADASALEALAAFSGRSIEERWRTTSTPIRVHKNDVPTKMDVPGAKARQMPDFGDATGLGKMAGEYFSLAAGTDIAPLLQGLEHDMCDAPHWGYMLEGEVVVTFVGGREFTFAGGDMFYWPPGHTVRVIEDTEVVLFSPQHQHVKVMDHMLAKLTG